MNTRAVTLSEDIRPDKEYVRWLREPGMAEQHDGRVTDKQPALILLHKPDMQDARKHRLHFRVILCRDTCPAKLPESRSPAAAGRALKRSVCRNGIGPML